MTPVYALVRMTRSRCPQEHPVTLLSPDTFSAPIFYICFECRTVFQAGVAGPVPELKEETI